MSLEDLDINAEFYDEREIRVEEQDLRLLKAIVTDDQAARELSNVYDTSLFVGDAKPFADKAISYFKAYSQLPTRRVMLDQAKENNSFFEEFEHIWDRLDKTDYDSSEFSYDLDKIKGRFTRHEIARLRDNIPDDIDLSKEQLEEVLKDARANLDHIEKVRKGRERAYVQKTLKEYMPEFREQFVQKSKNPELGRGILTGYSYIDYITNGLSPSDMLIIGGETGAGKSMFLANMAKQMWMQRNTIDMRDNFEKGHNVLYFSLEMPYDQCARRHMASMSDISTYALRDCQITDPAQLSRLADAANFIKTYPHEFEIVDIPRGVTVEQIEDRFLESVARGNRPDVVVIDYLGLMESADDDGDDWLRLGNIAGKLHELARTYNIVVLTAVQLNRSKNAGAKSYDPHDDVGMHRIGRSSNIMHHATVGIQILTRKNEDTCADLEYHVIKNRNGERGSHNIKKQFQTATLVDYVDEDGNRYVPKNDDSSLFTQVTTVEDISDRLEKLGW